MHFGIEFHSWHFDAPKLPQRNITNFQQTEYIDDERRMTSGSQLLLNWNLITSNMSQHRAAYGSC